MVALAYLKLVRFPILLLIAAIQYSALHFIIEPMIAINQYRLIMSESQLWMLIAATCLIAAGGFSINDYFDAKIDRINKPKTVVLDRLIKRRVAMLLHVVLSSLGLLLAGFLCFQLGVWKLTSLFIFAIFALWIYSTNLKHQALTGNLIIALMAAALPLIVGFLEIPLLNAQHAESLVELGFSVFNIPAYWLIAYGLLFALLTLAREMTKDVIDMKGDKMFGSKTIPIQLGIRKTKFIILFVYTLLLLTFGWLYLKFIIVHSLYVKIAFYTIIAILVAQYIIITLARTRSHFLKSVQINNAATVILLLSMYLIKRSIEAYFF